MQTLATLHKPSFKDREEWERYLYIWTVFFDEVGCTWQVDATLAASIYIPHLQLTFTAVPPQWGGECVAKWAENHHGYHAFAFAIGYPSDSARIYWYGSDETDMSAGNSEDVGYWQYYTGKGVSLYLPMMNNTDRIVTNANWEHIPAYDWVNKYAVDNTPLKQAMRRSFDVFVDTHTKKVRLPKANVSPIGKTLRFRILKRDKYRCQMCGRNAQDGVKLEVDHKIPRAKGGTNDERNLWTLCFDCNRGKRDKDL